MYVIVYDAIVLNFILTIKNPNERDEKLLPVMVWIPGGGFRGGHGGISVYGPHYLLDEDVVIVSMNYRIGIFGTKFLIFCNNQVCDR